MSIYLKLNVYIIGVGGNSFSVDIERSEFVGHLKQRILNRKKNDLKGIDADRLSLYKVSLSDDDTLKETAPYALQEKLVVASRAISKHFETDPPEETVSIVVTFGGFLGSEFRMNCFLN